MNVLIVLSKYLPESYELYDVESSNIKMLGYNEKQKALFAVFHNNNVYKYSNVNRKVLNILLEADSVGREFNKIKKLFEVVKMGLDYDV